MGTRRTAGSLLPVEGVGVLSRSAVSRLADLSFSAAIAALRSWRA